MNRSHSAARFYVVGVGPGAPDLMTLKAVRLIGMADVIAYPMTADGQSKARRTAADYITPHHEELPFRLPMALDPAPAQAAYDGAAQQIRAHLEAGRSIALLCEGDPFLYGSAMHLFVRLARDFTTRVVPGVSSVTAGAAAAGLPLASRTETLKVVPATLSEARLNEELARTDAAIIVKVGRHFAKVRRVIEGRGLKAAAVLVEAVSHDEQRVFDWSQINDDEHAYFSMIILSRHDRIAP